MNILIKTLTIAAIAITGISVPRDVLADNQRGPKAKSGFTQKISAQHRSGKSWKNGHNRGGNHARGRSYRSGKHYRGRVSHNVGNIFLGLGLGYLLFDGGNHHRPVYAERYSRSRHQAPQVVYVESRTNYSGYQGQYSNRSARNNNEFARAECLQIREYQTTIIIGGETREAYGDACLQPDGSWIQGTLNIAPN